MKLKLFVVLFCCENCSPSDCIPDRLSLLFSAGQMRFTKQRINPIYTCNVKVTDLRRQREQWLQVTGRRCTLFTVLLFLFLPLESAFWLLLAVWTFVVLVFRSLRLPLRVYLRKDCPFTIVCLFIWNHVKKWLLMHVCDTARFSV